MFPENAVARCSIAILKRFGGVVALVLGFRIRYFADAADQNGRDTATIHLRNLVTPSVQIERGTGFRETGKAIQQQAGDQV